MGNVWCRPCGRRRDSNDRVYRCGCGRAMRGRPPPQIGFDHFDHTFTPDEAQRIIDTIPDDSYHWADIPRIAPDAVDRYAKTMAAGKWQNETFDYGYGEHPIRWNADSELTHGVIRLLACTKAQVAFRSAVVCPPGLLQDLLWT